MELIYSFTVALFLTIALIPVAMRFAPALGLLDRPDARKQHTRVIPRCGGVAIALGVMLPLLALLTRDQPTLPSLYVYIFIACVIVVLFGVLDDRANLNYRWKFAGQIAATLLVLAGGCVIQRVPMMGLDVAPAWLSYSLSFLFIIGVTNAVNLTDGLDGLAGGTSILTLSVIAALALPTQNHVDSLIAVTLIGGILGFLRFNTYPAKVFMGDAGSQLLGFVAACLSILVSQADTTPLSPALPLLLLGIPVLDTLTVMCIRLRQRRSPFSPDRNHLHHQMIALGFRHNEAVAIIYILQFVLLAAAFTFRFSEDHILLTLYVAFCAMLLGSLHLARKRGWRFHAERSTQPFVDRRNIFLRRLNWYYAHAPQVMQVLIGGVLLLPMATHANSAPASALLLAAPLAAIFFLLRRYPHWCVRLSVYPASVWAAYLISTDPALREHILLINFYFVAIVALLALAIRMTRRDHFQLDTQDLLILVMVIVVPLLPFEWIHQFEIGEIVLRIAVLMYGCEYILGRTQGLTAWPLSGVAGVSLLYTLLFIS